MDLDKSAPVVGRKEVFIDAPLDFIRSLQSDVYPWCARSLRRCSGRSRPRSRYGRGA